MMPPTSTTDPTPAATPSAPSLVPNSGRPAPWGPQPGDPAPATPAEMARYIDHTLLKPEATAADVRQLCHEARTHGFAAVCVNSVWVPLAAESLSGSTVRVASVVGFPLGASTSATKAAEAAEAIRSGAREVDMVLAIGVFKSGDHAAVQGDVEAVAGACHGRGAACKVILEIGLLDTSEIESACRLAAAGGADFVKTSTGFGHGGATVEAVKLMRQAVGPRLGVKASGGVRTWADAMAMILAGANRLGTSAGIQIVGGITESRPDTTY